MKKQLLFASLATLLMVTGCAQKKVTAEDPNAAGYNNGMVDPNAATNVDPFGSGSGAYGNYNENSGYANGVGANGGIQNIYFGVDKYVITPEMLPTIISNASRLQGKNVKIEGHCDASGTDEYNFALGLRRAKAAKDAVVSRGVNPSNVTVVSLGESAPECATDYSSACYSKNRRVEFKVAQ